MEQAGVDHAGEALLNLVERQGILYPKVNNKGALRRLGLGPADRLGNKVDAGDAQSAGGKKDGGVTRSASGIEKRSLDLVRDRNERRLRLANVPRGNPSVCGFEGVTIGKGSHAVCSFCDASSERTLSVP